MKPVSKYPDALLMELVGKRNEGATYKAVASFIEKKYGVEMSDDSARKLYNKYSEYFTTTHTVENIQVLKEIARTKRARSRQAKENRTILDALNAQEDVIVAIQSAIENAKPRQVKLPKVPAANGFVSMTMEALLSDLHIGKLTKEFNLEVARNRLRKFTDVFIHEYTRKSQQYNVERIVLAVIGDLIENSVMHGSESLSGCEFQNPEQMRWCIQLLWEEVIYPIAMLGVRVDVVGVAGNHGRQEKSKTFQQPTLNSLEWVIMQSLQYICKTVNFVNVKWHITEGSYVVLDVYGNKICFEHGDLIKGFSRDACLRHLANRSTQEGQLLTGLRFGHIHTHMLYEDGRIISNASLCGMDSYSEALGYSSSPGQVINYYCDTKKRTNKYYHSFLVQL